MSNIMPGAEPFIYEGGDVGCLLLHGFTSTPQEMRPLGQFLKGKGFTVRGVLLAGHGTRVEDLHATTWRDWYQSAYEGWQALQGTCTRVFVIGQSLGGALALHLTAHVPLAGVVALATPLVTDVKLLWLARILKYVWPYRKKGLSNIHDPAALAARVAYRYTPNRSNEQAVLFFRHLHEDLPEVHTPTLLMHSYHDKTVDPASMPRIYAQLGAEDKQTVWLENSGHVVTVDYDRQLVYAAIERFIAGH
jgi:carboxylesterase